MRDKSDFGDIETTGQQFATPIELHNSDNQEMEMTYHEDKTKPPHHEAHHADHTCFGCGERIRHEAPFVAYDGWFGREKAVSVLMHPSCASAMAQRLITDTWPTRHLWKNELVSMK